MEMIPYSNDDIAKASEYLRLAISLLSKHRIPPSPLNFRLGYDYAMGNSMALRSALDQALGQPEAVDNRALWDIYRHFYIQDEEVLDKMRQELRQIIVNVQGELSRSGGNLAVYARTLTQFAEILDSETTPGVMSAKVQEVLHDTHSMEATQLQLESSMSVILSEVESLRRELEQIKEESLTDSLTGISNRKAFDSALENAIHQAREHKTPMCVALADIDHFKQFNDTYGHLVGDKVLRFVASTLKSCLKGKDIAARYGGEEFAIILPETSLDGAQIISEQVRKAISQGELKDTRNGRAYGKITISIGIGQFHWNELPNDLIQRTDQALYLAKERGRNRVEKAA